MKFYLSDFQRFQWGEMYEVHKMACMLYAKYKQPTVDQ